MSATTTHPAGNTARTADDTARQVGEIKALLRPLMNGVLSQSLRERGLRYRLIYGIELPRLKELAATLDKSHSLAQALWKEDIRECRILAGMLQPPETFLPDICDIWMDDIRDAELKNEAKSALLGKVESVANILKGTEASNNGKSPSPEVKP